MITLKQLYTAFGHDPKWKNLATASTQPMVSVYLRKLGDKNIESLTDFDIEMTYALSDQPEDRKVKAHSCMVHLLNWAREKGKNVPELTESASLNEAGEADDKQVYRRVRLCTQRGDLQIPRQKTDSDTLTMEQWLEDDRYRTGSIVPETVSKGWKGNKRVFRDRWRARIQIQGKKYYFHSKKREECKKWLKAVLSKEILPTDTKSDWWRMEQRKDEEARIDELIVSAVEEANIVYEYRQSGDTEILYDYCIKALLPHMVYYCAHNLHLGKERSLTCSRQAVGLILTKIVGGRPVTNITFTCKRMLRIYANRGDFWYYDKAPESVKLMVNRIDMSALEELYKVTKDRRL